MTFLKSTRKGLLKNVQDGISRPLGSREINKAKPRKGFFFTNPLLQCMIIHAKGDIN